MTQVLHYSPIIIAGLFAIAIFCERLHALYVAYPIQNQAQLFDQLRQLLLDNKTDEAIALCDALGDKPAAAVIKSALMRANQPEEMIQNGLSIAVSESIQKIQRRTQFLATIANVATLLGLLGTIFGLVHSFNAISTVDVQQKTVMLAQGIATAMNATMLGLAVAIPSMIGFSFLANRTNRLGAEIDQAAMRTMDIIKQRIYGL